MLDFEYAPFACSLIVCLPTLDKGIKGANGLIYRRTPEFGSVGVDYIDRVQIESLKKSIDALDILFSWYSVGTLVSVSYMPRSASDSNFRWQLKLTHPEYEPGSNNIVIPKLKYLFQVH